MTVAFDMKLEEYGRRLADHSVPVPELELRSILREVSQLAGNAGDHNLDAYVYNLMGLCYVRLSKLDKAADQFRLALQRVREPGPRRAGILSNQAAAFLALGRFKEAAQAAIEAARYHRDAVTLANLAESLARLGEFEMAEDVYADAVEALDTDKTDNAARVFDLAVTAAEIGFDQKAIEMFSRFLVLRGLASSPREASGISIASNEDVRVAYEHIPALNAVIQRALAFEIERSRKYPHDLTTSDENPQHSEAGSVFEATRGLVDDAVNLRLQAQDASH